MIQNPSFYSKLRALPWHPAQFFVEENCLQIYAMLTGGFVHPNEDFGDIPWNDDLFEEST